MDDFGLLVGRFFTTLPTLVDEQLSELQLDASGRLIISGRYLEDSAHVSGDAGIFVMGVRNDADAVLTSTDGDYTPFAVDSTGKLKVLADFDADFDYVYDEDSGHISADPGAYVLAVRQNTLASSTDADGDYASFKVNANGELYTTDTDAIALLTTIDVDTGNIATSTASIDTKLTTTNSLLTTIDADTSSIATDASTIAGDTTSIDANLTLLTQAEDDVHVSGDSGIMALAVRSDADGPFAANGDYTPLQTDAQGKLKVVTTIAVEGSEQYTVTDALAAAGDGIETITAAATPWVTVASLSHTSGTAYIHGWQWACDQNGDARIVTDDTSDIIVYKRALNSSAQPTYQEHFGTSGRIEIAGAASLEIKLQIRKRSATGGNANGTGSMHIRVA